MPLSAIDAVQPAIELTRQRLFRPAKYSMWWRIGVLGIFSGELSNGGAHFNLGVPSSPSNANHFASPEAGVIIMAGLVLAAIGIALALLFIYAASVLRFILFDATLTGRHRIRQGWRMWRDRARPYFRLQVLILFTLLAGLAIFAGTPVGLIYLRGGFAHKSLDGMTILLIVVAVLLGIAWLIAISVFTTLAKDFMLPMMALEGLDYDESWDRFRAMLMANKKDYMFYILMKIVLALAGSVFIGIFAVLALLAFGIPLGIAGAVLYFVFKVTIERWVGIALLVLGVLLLIALTAYTITMLCAPLAIFFPAYSIYFFAGRYQPLLDALTPPASPEAPPQAPPEPAPAF